MITREKYLSKIRPFYDQDLIKVIMGVRRYVSFKTYLFTFKEVCELKNITDRKDIEEVFDDYMTWGGMPQRFMMTDEVQTRTYLSDIYNSILVKDILI